jgi:WhiB family transcriptional regulator, redox-sensing transcriptional regulator
MTSLSIDDEVWTLAANCRGRTHLFFAPDDSESRAERRRREAQAKSVCQECVVRVECLQEAFEADERFGIWGGLTERERRAARRARPVGQALPLVSRTSPQDIAGPGRLARLPAVVVQGRPMSSHDEN